MVKRYYPPLVTDAPLSPNDTYPVVELLIEEP